MIVSNFMKKILNVWILLLVLQTGSVLYLNYSKYISALFVLVSLVIMIKHSKSLVFKRKELIYLLLYYILILLSASVAYFETGFISNSLVTHLLKITCIYIVLKIIGWNKFIDNFSKVILWLMLISFIMFIFVLMGIDLPLTYGVIGETPSYFYLLRTTGVDFNVGFNMIRNAGPFYEPGIYQVLLNFALLYYYSIKRNNRLAFIIVVVIVSTLSPIGIIISGVIISSKYWNVLKRPKSFIYLILIISISLYFMVPFVINKMSSLSFQLRMYDLKSGFLLFLKNPFFGLGFENHNLHIIDSIEDFGISRKNSNGLINLILGNGIFFSIFYLFLLFKGFLNNTKRFVWIYVAIFQLIAQPIYLSTVFMVFISLGIIGDKSDANNVNGQKII